MILSMQAPSGPGAVNFGKQKVLPVPASGTISFELVIPGHQGIQIQLTDVLYVPEAGPGLNILSVSTLHKHGHGVNLDHALGVVRWSHNGVNVKQTCDWQDHVPDVQVNTVSCRAAVSSVSACSLCCHISAPPSVLSVPHHHCRFWHAGNNALAALAKLHAFPKSVVKQYKQHSCSDCKLAYADRDGYPHVDGLAKLPGDVLHVDLLHFPEHTFDGKKYALMIIDDFTRLVEIALLSKKSEAAVHLVAVMTRYKTLQNRSVKYLRSDMGGDFHSTVLKIEKQHLGVTDQHVPARCHESNGFIERVNRTVAEGVRAVLKASHMPLGLWGEALQYVKHTYNLTPHTALIARGCDVPIPHVLFHNEYAERLVRLHAQLLPFGMACFVHRVEEHPKKLADRSEAGYIVGYGPRRVCIGSSLLTVHRA
jgi:transposase InsO family protein